MNSISIGKPTDATRRRRSPGATGTSPRAPRSGAAEKENLNLKKGMLERPFVKDVQEDKHVIFVDANLYRIERLEVEKPRINKKFCKLIPNIFIRIILEISFVK